MFARTGVSTLTCRAGGAHQARTARLTVTTARLSDMSYVHGLADESARHWLGWGPAPAAAEFEGLAGDPLLWAGAFMKFLARDLRTGVPVASVSLYLDGDGRYQVGGVVGDGHRGLGYGREALDLVCRIAHRHLGIADLAACCEITNQASRRWLSSCGFLPVDGPGVFKLPNGRTIEACWWSRSGAARLRCRNRPLGGIGVPAADTTSGAARTRPSPMALSGRGAAADDTTHRARTGWSPWR